MLEAHRNMFARDIWSHCNDWGRINLPDKVSRRNTVQIRHDGIHKHKIVSRASGKSRHRLKAIWGRIDLALQRLQQDTANTPTSLIIFHQQD
jgi:hypothetical protein